MPTKAELIERHEQLLKLDEVLSDHEKTEHFSMSAWSTPTNCGTVCCLLGHAGLTPWFREHGVETLELKNDVLVLGKTAWDEEVVGNFFGKRAFEEMFCASLSSVWPEAMQRVRDRLERIKAEPEGTY